MMATWHITCHGDAVNLDMAHQVSIVQAKDGTFRLTAEFLNPGEVGGARFHTLEAGLPSREEADAMLRRILFGLDLPVITQVERETASARDR